jgi:integrase
MSRPRKSDKHLPAYVRIMHGSYQYRGKAISRVEDGESAMYEALAKRKAIGDISIVPAAVAQYKIEYLPTLTSIEVRKEHGRILDVFSEEFSEFRVDQITAPAIRKSIKNLYSEHPSAAKSYKARVSTFFAWAVSEAELVNVNPCREVKVKVPPSRRTPWTPALFWAVRALLSPMHQVYHDLSFLLYQRTTDVRRLNKPKQLLEDGIHFEPSKTLHSTGASVIIPYSTAIREVLERAAELSKQMGVVCPFVIHTSKGAPYTRSGIHSAYRRADAEIHGKPIGLNPKALLPFAMTQAKKQGATTPQLQVGRAHASITTTEGYIHAHETPVSEVVLRLPANPKGTT